MVMMDRPRRRAQRLMSRGMPRAPRGSPFSLPVFRPEMLPANAVCAFEPRSKRPCRNRGHVVDRVEKQRTNDRLLADQRHGGVSLRNPLECLGANRLADHIFRNAELPDQVYYSSPLRSRIPGRFPDQIRDWVAPAPIIPPATQQSCINNQHRDPSWSCAPGGLSPERRPRRGLPGMTWQAPPAPR